MYFFFYQGVSFRNYFSHLIVLFDLFLMNFETSLICDQKEDQCSIFWDHQLIQCS